MAVFTWDPQTASKTVTPRVLKAEFGDGYTQRTGDGINNSPREYALTFQAVAATIFAIDAFLQAENGVTAFDWTPPDGTVGRWICESWGVTYNPGMGSALLSATFKEVFGQ